MYFISSSGRYSEMAGSRGSDNGHQSYLSLTLHLSSLLNVWFHWLWASFFPTTEFFHHGDSAMATGSSSFSSQRMRGDFLDGLIENSKGRVMLAQLGCVPIREIITTVEWNDLQACVTYPPLGPGVGTEWGIIAPKPHGMRQEWLSKGKVVRQASLV